MFDNWEQHFWIFTLFLNLLISSFSSILKTSKNMDEVKLFVPLFWQFIINVVQIDNKNGKILKTKFLFFRSHMKFKDWNDYNLLPFYYSVYSHKSCIGGAFSWCYCEHNKHCEQFEQFITSCWSCIIASKQTDTKQEKISELQ